MSRQPHHSKNYGGIRLGSGRKGADMYPPADGDELELYPRRSFTVEGGPVYLEEGDGIAYENAQRVAVLLKKMGLSPVFSVVAPDGVEKRKVPHKRVEAPVVRDILYDRGPEGFTIPELARALFKPGDELWSPMDQKAGENKAHMWMAKLRREGVATRFYRHSDGKAIYIHVQRAAALQPADK